jgi:hypothetical protein
MTNARLAGC